MKIYFKVMNRVPFESVSEPFTDPINGQLMFLCRNMESGIIKKIYYNDIDKKEVYTDRHIFERILRL